MSTSAPRAGSAHPRSRSRRRHAVLCALTLAGAGLGPASASAALAPLDAFGGSGAGPAQLARSASGIALAPSGRVYVADTDNHRVQSFTPSGAPAGAFTGTGAGRARLNRPVGVAVDGAGSVWVTEAQGDRLHRYTADGVATGSIGPRGNGPGHLSDPRGVAIGRDGALLVVDAAHARVQVYAPSGAFLGAWGSRGSGPGRFTDPDGIAVAPEGDVYVTDRAARRVQRFSQAGAFLGAFDGGGSAAGALGKPTGVAVDRTGAVHVADTGRDRVVTFTPGGSVVDWTATAPATHLAGLASDCRTSVYVVDAGGGLVRRFGRPGAAPPPCTPPTAAFTASAAAVEVGTEVRFDGSGSSDDGRVVRWDWDLDGDGGFERTDGGPVTARSFDDAGTVVVGLRVTDDDGGQAVTSRTIAVSAPTPEPEPGPPPAAAPTPLAPPLPGPVIGVTTLAEVTQGTVRFRRPGGARTELLTGRPLLPVGTRFDTTGGRVRLTLAVNRGTETQSGVFWGGVFTPLQGTGSALTELVLADAELAPRAAPRGVVGRAAQARKRRSSRLWGNARGRFRTTGRNAVATVRGTRWLTEDDGAGTTVTVVEGVVSVRNTVTGKTVEVPAGGRYVARDACESRRSFRIRLRVPVGARVRSATVVANGRRVPVTSRDGRLTALIDLRGRPAGSQLVRITLVTTKGVRLTGTRSYRTCAGRLPYGAAPGL